MALPEVKNLKNARYLIGYKATLKSMRPDCIQDLFPQWNWSCRKTGHKQRQKKTSLQLFTTIICKKCPSSIQCRDSNLWNVSLFPLPLDQGSRPNESYFYNSILKDIQWFIGNNFS